MNPTIEAFPSKDVSLLHFNTYIETTDLRSLKPFSEEPAVFFFFFRYKLFSMGFLMVVISTSLFSHDSSILLVGLF